MNRLRPPVPPQPPQMPPQMTHLADPSCNNLPLQFNNKNRPHYIEDDDSGQQAYASKFQSPKFCLENYCGPQLSLFKGKIKVLLISVL